MQSRWRECTEDNAALDNIVLEAQRLWPPFIGGRRVCTQVSGVLRALLTLTQKKTFSVL